MLWRRSKFERHLIVVARHIPIFVPIVFGAAHNVPVLHLAAIATLESGMNLLTRTGIKFAPFSDIVESTLVAVRSYLRRSIFIHFHDRYLPIG